MKRRIISFLTAFAAVASIFQTMLPAASAETVGIYGWTYNSTAADASCSLSPMYYCGGTHSALLSTETANTSVTLQTNVNMEKGKTYTVKFLAKAVNVQAATFSVGSSKYNLVSVMKNYNWTAYEYSYMHQGDSGAYPLIFSLNGTGKLYIDDVYVRETNTDGTSKTNLVTNPSFEEEGEAYVAAVVTPFAQTDMDTVMETFADAGSMPLLYGEDIAIDGNMSEWKGYPTVSLPSKAKTVDTMKNYSGDTDASVDFMTAYDDEYLYLYAEVTDDTHSQPNVGERYWTGDSLQLAIGTTEEDFGIEVGFYLTDDGQSLAYSTELEKTLWGSVEEKVLELREKTICKAYREGDKTYYEASIPWKIKFDEIPDEFLLNLLVNDNDGSGREGYFEWYPGIGGTKSNELFAVIFPIENNSDVFAYIDGSRNMLENNTDTYNLYIFNLSQEEKNINVNLNNTESGDIIVSPGYAYLWPFEVKAGETGDMSISADLIYNGGNYRTQRTVPVILDIPLGISQMRENEFKELKELQAKCNDKGITTDYEDITINTIDRFIEYGLEDFYGGRESRAGYVYDCLVKLYDEAKTSLTAYLDGTQIPKDVKYYQISDLEIERKSIYADRVDAKTGEITHGPVFLTGYNCNEKSSDEMATVGANMMQFEITMAQVMQNPDTPRGWGLSKVGGVNASVEYSDDAYKGDYSIKISNASARASNVYASMTQGIPLEAGKKYTLSFYAKGDGVNGCAFRPDAWRTAKIPISGSAEWQKYTYTYEPEKDMSAELMFVCEDITNALYIDNIRIVEKGSNKNLVNHGSFEEKPVIINGYAVNVDRVLNEFIPYLDEAQRNNVAVDLLLAYHYFPKTLLRGDAWSSPNVNYGIYLDDESVQDMMEAFFKGVTAVVKDHPALSSICISNEPGYNYGDDERYLPKWQEYLKKLYNNDVALMNKIYHTSFAGFEDVPFGGRDTAYENDAIYYDYICFNDKMFKEFQARNASYVKEAAPDVPVHAKMMSVVEKAEPVRSNTPLARGTNPEMWAEFSDIMGHDAWNFIDSQKDLTVKMLWYDLLTSVKDAPAFNSEDHMVVDGDERYDERFAPHYATDIWQGALHGRTMTAIWKWGRTLATNNQTSSNIKHRPDAVALAGHTILDLNRLSEEMSALQNDKPEFGIYYSYPSRVYSETHMSGVYETYKTLGNAGQRSKIFTEKMIKENKLNDIKVLLVPNVVSTEADVLEGIKSFIQNGGKVLLIGDCFSFDEHKNAFENTDVLDYIISNSEKLDASANGNVLTPDNSIDAVLKKMVREVLGENIEVIDADTGLPITDSEWCYMEYEGSVILNLLYMNRYEGKNITIRVDGKPVENAKDLITEKILDETFCINGYDPMLIRIER